MAILLMNDVTLANWRGDDVLFKITLEAYLMNSIIERILVVIYDTNINIVFYSLVKELIVLVL